MAEIEVLREIKPTSLENINGKILPRYTSRDFWDGWRVVLKLARSRQSSSVEQKVGIVKRSWVYKDRSSVSTGGPAIELEEVGSGYSSTKEGKEGTGNS